MSELKPCKKCGSNSNLTSGSDRDGNYVYCKCSPRKWVDLKVWQSEPTIKVSELREWCEERIIEWEPTTFNQTESVVNEMKMILNKFCGGKKMDSNMFSVPLWVTLLYATIFSFIGWCFWEFIFYVTSFIHISIGS